MKLKNLIIVALLLAIGTILHAVVPGLVFGMKSDLSLVMLFLCLFFFADKKSFMIIGLADGMLAGLTTQLPGGFIPNVIDKLITTPVVFLAFLLCAKFFAPKGRYIAGMIIAGLGTVLSGTIFATVLIILTNVQASIFMQLIVAMVLPTAGMNAVLMAILYPIILQVGRRSGFIKTSSKPPVY
ncbi:MAG: tryptophan transporter [Sporolactobacillus sp.]|jgi:hypothetical protein|nr:tryptophan transporter [Sporolactobacillus sp.]MCI1882546.1 tryptophan transporter [Sporolactobacillus sp.]